MTIGRCALLTVGLLSLVGASALAYYPMGRYNTAVSPNVLIPARYDVTALPNSTITFYLTTQRPQTLAPGDSVEAIISELAAAAAVWNSVSSSALRVGFGGYTKVSGARPLVNPIGVIGFSDSIPPGAAAVGGTVFRIPSGTPAFLPVVASFVDMPLDMSRTNSSSNSFLGIVVHEMGHSLGAAHSHVAAVMFQSGGTSRARVLTEDDVALIAELYPAASVASSTGSISGRVVTASGQGASVVGVGAFSDTAVVGGMTGPDGNFTIRGLPPGTYRLMVQPLMLGGAPSPDADNPGDPADLIRVRTLTNEVVRINTDIDSAFFAGGGATTRDRNAAATFPVNAGQTTAGAQITIGSRGPLRLEANDTRTIAAPNVPSFRSPGFVWVTRGGQAAGFSTGRALTTPGLQISFTNPGVSTAGSPTTFFSSDPDEVFNTAIGYPVQATPTAVLGSSSVLYLNAGDAYFSPGHLRVVASGPPQISGISPASGPPQTAITITGSSFTDSSRVYFDGMPATVTARTATTSLVVVAPLGASRRGAAVFVANEDGQGSEFLAAPPLFTYSSAPQPSLSISPSTAGLGQSLTVRVTGTNTNFRAGETVLGFGSGDVVVNSVTVESPTLLTASVRVSAVVSSGTFPVTAITGEQVAFLDDGFTVATPPPTSHLLTSGQPAPYSLPAVTGNTLFTGDFSYQIVVPSGATRLDVQLRTTTPGVDVDLFVRFGQDIALSGGQVVADFKSEGLTGDENISITTGSSPALRAGTYYIAFGLFTFNTPVSGTITATAQPGSLVPSVPPTGILNAAGFDRSVAGVSPGAIVSIFGTNLSNAPATGVEPGLVPGTDMLSVTSHGTQVTFDGVSAPLFFVRSGQLNVQVPFEVAGRSSTQMIVRLAGTPSAPVTVTVLPATPGLFTFDSSGRGRAVLLNEDGTLNSAANAAARGSVIQLFATGLGAVSPAVATGRLAPTSPPLALSTEVPVITIGGVPAMVEFSGLSPGFVGLWQVNARVPSGTAAGEVTLLLRTGGRDANPVTVFTR